MLESTDNAESFLPRWVPTRAQAVRIVTWYAALSLLWICGSGWLLHHFIHDDALEAALKNAMRWSFVAVTAFLLGLLLNRNFRAIRQAVSELQESERRLRLMGDNLPDSYVYQYTTDPDGRPRFTYVSAGVKRVHGLEPAEVLRDGGCIFRQMDTAQLAAYATAEAESARNLTNFEMDFRLRRPDGTERVIHAKSKPSRDAEGRVTWDGFTVDVTRQKRTEAAVRERERQLRLCIEHSPAAIAMLDRNLRYLVVSRRWLADYRLGEVDVTGRSHYEVFPEIPERWREIHRRCLAGAVEKSEADAFRRADGSVDWVRWEIRPWHDDQGAVGGLIIFSEVITARRQAEEALRLSEMKFARAFANNPAAIVLTRLKNGVVVDANETWLGLTGFRREEVLRRSVRAMWPDAAAAERFVRELRERGVVRSREQEFRRKSGEIFVAELSSQVLTIGEEQIVLSTLVDVTERKRMEEALRRSEQNYREIFNATNEAIFLHDAQTGRVLDVNETMLRMHGYTSKEEFLAGQPDELPAPEPLYNFEETRRRIRLAVEEGPQVFERLNRKKSGETFWVEVSLRSSEIGGQGRVLAVVRDITERKESEREKLRLVTALEQAAESIIMTDPEGMIVYVNPACERISGYSREELLGQNPRLFKSGKHEAEFYRQMWDTVRRGEVWHGHFVNRRRDGTLYEEDATISPVRDSAGKIANFMAIKLDVTREVELEKRFLQAQKLEAIGQLAGGVAHDFNNILAAMMMQVALLETGEDLSPEVQMGLEQIRICAERAANLTRQLVLFSRKQVMQTRDLDLNEVVRNLAKMLQRLIGEDVRMQLQLGSRPMWTRADAGMLDQVLLNLAVNARDAMPDGGSLRIETAEEELDAGSAHLPPEAVPGRYLCLRVTDTGCGIAPEVMPHIFEPFFTTKGPGKGTGLGLATVFGIIKQHRGWIEADSEPQRGTTFRIYLPVSDAAGESERADEGVEPDGGKETILLTEDDPSVRMTTRALLEWHGYTVLEAADGVEALKVWETQRDEVALLLTDLVMPAGISGQQLARQLQAAKPDLKVIFISGYSAEIAGKDLQLRKGENFVQKPFTPNHLLETLRRSLDRRPGSEQ